MLNINDIIEFENVKGKLGDDGFVYFLIDDVARELGFDKEEEIERRPDLVAIDKQNYRYKNSIR